jgi:8-oxo-dGTP pyrophosphatase MutT (NUDIX family)
MNAASLAVAPLELDPDRKPQESQRGTFCIIPSMLAKKPEITVAAITQDKGRFLVVEEYIKRRLVFNQPAGHVEQGESLLTAVIREVREETAWRFVPESLVGVYLWQSPVSGTTTMRFAFSGTVDDHHAAQPLDRGIVGTHWLSRADLLQREQALRSPLVLRCIEDYLGGSRQPLDSVAHLDLLTALAIPAVPV